MLRSALLWLSRREGLFRFLKRRRLTRRLAERFVAGETIEEALGAAAALAARDITASLDFLGESVHRADEARAAADQYLRILGQMADAGLEVNVSLKPSQMGMDLDLALCEEGVARIVERARALRGFVRFDMESSAYTDRTLDLFAERIHPRFGDAAGVVVQAALRRSPDDIERLIGLGARVRLCKGAYLEPPEIAFPRKQDVDAQYVRLMERLLERGRYPAIATHDERILSQARRFVGERGIDPAGFEFQMLYGVRRDLQDGLRKEGYRLRVYLPFGTQWYPYLMRRLAERPANLTFFLASLLREGLSGRRIRK